MDRKHRLAPVDIRSAEGTALLTGLTPEERLSSWHLVADGKTYSAGAAFAPLLDRVGFGGLPVRAVGAFPRVVEGAYGWVADRRSFFGRLVSDRADRRASERIASRS